MQCAHEKQYEKHDGHEKKYAKKTCFQICYLAGHSVSSQYNWGEDIQVSLHLPQQFKYMIFHIIYLTVSSQSLGILRTHNLTSS